MRGGVARGNRPGIQGRVAPDQGDADATCAEKGGGGPAGDRCPARGEVYDVG